MNLLAIKMPEVPFDIWNSLVLLTRRGSESHGLYIPPEEEMGTDDRDVFGVCIPPASYYLGLPQWEGAESIKGVWDVVLYEWRKLIRLLMKQNPNVLGMLWLHEKDYLHVSEVGRLLIDNRHLFRLRSLAYKSFIGYANSQLKKMDRQIFEGYMGMKRKAIVERFGYDVKNAAHLIRLLHMGREYLETGELTVRRGWDRPTLLEIKTGQWPLESVKHYAADLFTRCREAYDKSPLPTELNYQAINQLVVEGVETHLQLAQ